MLLWCIRTVAEEFYPGREAPYEPHILADSTRAA
jgi:hypothetical protein